MVLVVVSSSSETDAAESTVYNVLWRNDIRELSGGELSGNIVSRDRKTLREVEGRDEFGNLNSKGRIQ